MADPPESKPSARIDFDTSIGFLVTSLANKLNNGASRWLKQRLGVGLMEWRAILLLAVEGEVFPGRIAQVAGVDKSVVSRALASLEGRGLLRVTPDPQLGRQTRVALTEAGQALHDRGIEETLARQGRLIEGFTSEERRILIDLLKRMGVNHARRLGGEA